MPLYHFDLVHGKNRLDAVDAEASDDIEAMDCAESIARRILRIWPGREEPPLFDPRHRPGR